MHFTILSHAGLLVEQDRTSVLCDPWLVGSCYWRSWWNLPEPDPETIRALAPDFVYLTHLHWDHFHGPSLRRLSRTTPILVPKLPTRRMVDDLGHLGFRDVREVPHGARVRLGPSLVLASYQSGSGSDSAVVLSDGRTHLFNLNDAKLFGGPLHQLLADFGRPDFLLRSYSSASAVPHCIDGSRDAFQDLRRPEDYVAEFAAVALHTGARYAVPFASNHCFLHRETVRFNPLLVSPGDVRIRLSRDAERIGADTECVVMPPGSSWSDADGFRLRPFDYGDREGYVRYLLSRHAAALGSCYEMEDRVAPDFASFERYFARFVACLPPGSWGRRRPPLLFRARHALGHADWIVDPGRREVRAARAGDEESALVVECHARVFRECCERRMFSTWSASKRLRIRLPTTSDLGSFQLLLQLLDANELDHLPLSRNLRPRHLGVFARRWREGVAAAGLAVRHGLLRRPFRMLDLYPLPARRDATTGGRQPSP